MTLDASRLMVLAMTAPQPSSKALPMTLALVPGGPEPMTKGLGNLIPLTVVARVGIHYLVAKAIGLGFSRAVVGAHQQVIYNKTDEKRDETGVNVEVIEKVGLG